MATQKESHFFAKQSAWEKGAAYHNALFKAEESTRFYGDSSTIYCICEHARHRIETMLDQPRIILLLRDPVERLLSHYRWLWALGLESRPLLQAVREAGDDFDPEHHDRGNYFAYCTFSNYARYVPEWQRAFGTDRVLIVVSDMLKVDPQETLSGVWDFLGLEKFDLLGTVRANRTQGIKPISQAGWAQRLSAVLPNSLTRSLRQSRRIQSIWRDVSRSSARGTPEITETDREALGRILAADIQYYRNLVESRAHS